MNAEGLTVEVGTFTAKATLDGQRIAVVCAGEGDAAALAPLDELLKNLHSAAEGAKTTEVSLDLREVSFMNSSCFTKLIGWITRIRKMPQEAQYRIRIKSNQQVLWQRRSLHALQCFALDLITIES